MSGNIALITATLKAHYAIFSCFFEVRVIILFQRRTAKKWNLDFKYMLRLKDNVSQCISFYCMHWQVRKDTVGKCTDKHSNHFRYFSIFSQNVAHVFEEFGLFDSSLYCDKMEDYDENGEEYKPYMGRMKNKDLIFKDCSNSLELIPEVILLCFISFTKRRFTRYYLNERKSMGRKRLIVKDIAVGILSRM